MSDNNSSVRSGGAGVVGLLGVAFVVLKLMHVISWSWWWVLAPFWMPLILVIGVFVIAGIIMVSDR